WVSDDEMRRLMHRKAAAGELILCLPKHTTLSNELELAGATVFLHDLRDPAVRFTITQYTSASYCVSVARPDKSSHVIEEYPAGHPVAALTRDLVELSRIHSGTAPKGLP